MGHSCDCRESVMGYAFSKRGTFHYVKRKARASVDQNGAHERGAIVTIAIQRMKERLEQKQTELLMLIQELQGGRSSSSKAETAQNEQAVADAALKFSGANQERSVLANELGLLAEVQWALKRIADGTYGSCAVCRQPIPEKRLEALPWAALCVRDQEQLEHGQPPRPLAALR